MAGTCPVIAKSTSPHCTATKINMDADMENIVWLPRPRVSSSENFHKVPDLQHIPSIYYSQFSVATNTSTIFHLK